MKSEGEKSEEVVWLTSDDYVYISRGLDALCLQYYSYSQDAQTKYGQDMWAQKYEGAMQTRLKVLNAALSRKVMKRQEEGSE